MPSAIESTTQFASIPSAPGNRPAAASSDLSGKDMFLKLLVAQIRHQNPLSPADGVEFLSQLAQFTQLEQSIAMRQDLDLIRRALTEKPAPAGQPTSGGKP